MGDAASPSRRLLGRLQGLADLVLSLLQTRLELLGNELQLEMLRAFDALLRGVAALLLLMFGGFFAMVLVVALLWDSHRLAALAGAATLCIGVGLWLLLAARRRLLNAGQLFAASLAELARDREQVGPPP
jgi:uncharacterized membrane protein YqjE